MESLSYENHLCSPADPEKILRLSKIVFVEGHLDRLDDLLITILPLANLVYYRSIKQLDDREYAKEDLISDAITGLYQDMSLRWDKYIRIDSYYDYYSTILKNIMIELVHGYHNFYVMDDVDPESIFKESITDRSFDELESKIIRSSLKDDILSTSERILRCRRVNTKLLLSILRIEYVEKGSLESLRSRVRVVGVPTALFDFYCEHVEYVYRLSSHYHYAALGGKDKMTERISNVINRFEDVTYRMLSEDYYDSILPEIYAEFGADVAKKFVKTFSGRTVQVPDYRNFCDNLLGGVVLTLAGDDRTNLYRVADEYQVPYKILSRIYNKAIKYKD